MRLGIDVDGVLADFNTSFINRTISVTGVDLFPPRPFDIPIWDYPQHYGYGAAQVEAAWENICADPMFWAKLPLYDWTQAFLRRLNTSTDDVYFITSRLGAGPKQQTEAWLQYYGGPIYPTVLISGAKGYCCKALQIDVYIDDRDKNVIDVRTTSPATRVFLLDQPWNRTPGVTEAKGIERITNPLEMLDAIGR